MIDVNHPFYEPLWRRALIVGVCLVWAMVELVTGSVTWAVISGGLGAFAAYKLFIEKPAPNSAPNSAPKPPAAPPADQE